MGVILAWLLSLATLSVSSLSISDAYILDNFEEKPCIYLTDAMEKNIEQETDQNLLDMSIYYGSLCESCKDFFKNQFNNIWQDFYKYLNLNLIPYGNASKHCVEGQWQFNCEHGEEECYYNLIQACALNKFTGRLLKDRYSFISCFQSLDDKKQASDCTKNLTGSFEELDNCAKSELGLNLLAGFGMKTEHVLSHSLQFPAIYFNEKFNQTECDLATTDLKVLLCEKLEKLGYKLDTCKPC